MVHSSRSIDYKNFCFTDLVGNFKTLEDHDTRNGVRKQPLVKFLVDVQCVQDNSNSGGPSGENEGAL